VLVIILSSIAGLIALLVLLAMLKPNTFRYERSAAIAASPEKVVAVLSDFHEWSKWSPWEKLDPTMTRTHSGAASGVGAIYEWTGNKKVGSGRMEILETSPTLVKVKLDFLTPFEAHNLTDFEVTKTASGCDVKWVMHGPALFMNRFMGTFINFEKMIGKDFENGLANLKAVVTAA
jgi:hypothetical protein